MLSSLFSHRLGQDLVRIANLEGGISKLPILAGLAFADTRSLTTAYIHASETRIWKLLHWNIFALMTAFAIVALTVMWRRHPHDEIWLLPMHLFRSVSVLAIVVFSATIACVPTPGNSGDSSYLLLANGSLAASSEGYPSGSTSTRMSTLGTYYYITSQNGSTDIVTDSYGKAVARFAYDPYGRVNQQLTDLDPDRNSVVFGDSFFYTGQELEAETGLYDYHARIYDPETGRFLQPDPVHSENAGMDNWDRYAYVNGNPVNFTDPRGMSTNYGHMWNQALGTVSGNFNKSTRGLVRGYKDWAAGIRSGWNSFAKGAFHSANHFTGGVAHSFNGYTGGLVRGAKDFAGGARGSWNHWATGAIHGFNHFTGTDDFKAWVIYEMSGMTPDEFWLLYFGTRESTEETWFGHNYTGPAGNLDPDDDYHTQKSAFLLKILALKLYTSSGSGLTGEEIAYFLLMVQFLSPRPVSFADTLGLRHDHEWPLVKNPLRIFDAGNHWITGWVRGIPTKEFWQKPIDSIVVGGLGSVLMGCINFCWMGAL